MASAQLALFQARIEQRAFWRSPDYALFTFALPVVLLVVLGSTNRGDVIPGSHVRAVTVLVPSVIAFGVVVAAYANLATKLASLRHDGVLKRMRTTPLEPRIYLAGSLLSTLVTTLVIALVTAGIGTIAFDASPRAGGWPALVIGLLVGITCFASLGLAISAVVPSVEAAGPITNASYLPAAIVSGVFDPTLELPRWLSHVMGALPIRPLADVLESAYQQGARGIPGTQLGVLALWTALGLVLAVRLFKWEP
ncbi:MAG TPA: ABC transporter permease [Acidimicrobiales bacterium]|nr:ABC transporter permease [Acidimicrobiales bacterium]